MVSLFILLAKEKLWVYIRNPILAQILRIENIRNIQLLPRFGSEYYSR